MHPSQSIFNMKHLLAAFIFFTRLPFWRLGNVSIEYFKRVVDYWPVVGYLTGGIMAAVLYLSAQVFPVSVAVLFAILSRVLITGALHEDGLADFCDGFGGGTNRERILAIMKDSYIGTYGVLGLILYFLLFYTTLNHLPYLLVCAVLFCGDIWSKFCASQVVNLLPYARKEEDSKNKVIYERMNKQQLLISLVIAILPSLLLLKIKYWIALLIPAIVVYLLILLMKRKIQGYTGDCCGALFLFAELSYYLTILALY